MKRLFNHVIIAALLSAALYCTLSAESDYQKQAAPSYNVVRGANGRQDRLPLEFGESLISVQQGDRSLGVQLVGAESTRVIIELHEPPLASLARQYSLPQVEGERQQRISALRNLGDQIANIENAARTGRGLAALNRSSVVTHEYALVFHGLAATLSPESIAAVSQLPQVKRVWPDMMRRALVDVSVPKVRANEVWSTLGATGQGVLVAIVDTGIDYTHKDLGGCLGAECRVKAGFNFVDPGRSPTDDNGHGTHVAGIVAANGVVKGVAPDVRLLAVKVLDADGGGRDAALLAGIEWAVIQGADVMNLSLGGPGTPDDPASQALDHAVEMGCMVVVAAGNQGPDFDTVDSPGVARTVLTVGASSDTDGLADFSSRGPSLIYQMKPEILAPGVAINSTVPKGKCELCSSTGYAALDGTSMAAPHVAGAAALLLQRYPDWTPAQVKAALMQSAVDLHFDAFEQGAGRLDVFAAATFPTLPSTGVFNYGLDDLTGPTFGNTQSLTLTNTTTSTQTCSLSVSGVLPTGITAGLSANSLTIPPGESRTVEFSLNIDNNLTPHASEAPYDYSGAVAVDIGGQRARIPFVAVKSSVLHLDFGDSTSLEDQGLLVLVHNPSYAKGFWVYGNEMTVCLPPGVFNVVTLFGDASSYVVREGISLTQRIEIAQSRAQAPHVIKILPVYNTGLSLPITGDPVSLSSFRSKDGQVEVRVFAVADLKSWNFSNVSSSYAFEAAYFRNGFPYNKPSFGFYAHALNGVSAPVTFKNQNTDFKHFQVRHGIGEGLATVVAENGIYFRDGDGVQQGNPGTGWWETDWEVNSQAKAPMTEEYYLMPEPYAGFELGYIQESIFEGTYAPGNILYSTPYLRAASQPLRLNGFLPYEFGTPALSTTVEFVPFGTAPFSWFGRFSNATNELNLGAALGHWPWLFLGQGREVRSHTNFTWELWQGTKKIKSGTLSGAPVAPGWFSIPVTPGSYTFKTSSRFNGTTAPGEGKIAATFNTSAADPNPPYLTSFQIMTGARISPTVQPTGGAVVFRTADDKGISSVALSYDDGSGFKTATVQSLGGGQYSANIPAPAEKVNLKLQVVDTASNSIVYETSALRMLLDMQLGIAHSGDFRVGTKPTFAIKLTNVGTEPAVQTLRLVSTLPAGLKYDSFSGTGWTCTGDGQTVTCQNPNPLQVGAYSTVTIRTLVTQAAAQYSFSSDLNYTGDMDSSNDSLTDHVVLERWTTPLLTAEDLYVLLVDPTDPNVIYAGTNRGVFHSSDGGANWAIFNPGTDLRVRALVLDPHDNRILYVGALGQGVYKTTDRGDTWTAVNTGLTNLSVTSLAMDPVNSELLYATAGNFLYKTVDSAKNWAVLPTGVTGKAHTKVVVSPNDANTLFVGTAVGVLKTTNGGSSWTTSLTDSAFNRVNCIVFRPANPQTIYVGTNAGVYLTSNGGATWTYASQGLNKLDVLCIEVDPTQPDVLFAGLAGGGVYRSVNGGLSWSSFGLGLGSATIYDIVLKGSIYAAASTGFVSITLRPDLAVALEHSGPFLTGGIGRYTIRVTNAGLAQATGSTSLVATLPAGLAYVSAAGSGWGCSPVGNEIRCSKASAISTSASSDVAVMVAIAQSAPASCLTSVAVQNASDSNAANNSATDTASVTTGIPLWFPFYQANASTYTGFGMSNTSGQPASLQFIAHGTEGQLLPYANNPASFDLGAGEQKALGGGEIFSTSGDQAGWVKLLSDTKVAGLFLFGGASMMDGSVALSEKATKFYFTRVFEGPTSFRGQSASTRLSLVNPNPAPITLTLKLHGASAAVVATKTLALAAGGYYFDSVANTFPGIGNVASGYIEVECVEGPGAIGFELVQLTNHNTLIGLNGAVPADSKHLYSAQLAQVPGLFTNVKLINTTDAVRLVDLTAVLIDGQGKPYTQVYTKSLKAGEVIESDAATLFGWATGTANVGSLKVESNYAGVIGDVVFGDTGFGYNAALLLQSSSFERAVFSQVANGLGLFTGLALYNPGGLTANATIEVFSEEGAKTGSTTVQLSPGQRTAQLLTELIPSTIDQIKGYVIIQSNTPLIAQQLFGDGRFLAAVPPTVLE